MNLNKFLIKSYELFNSNFYYYDIKNILKPLTEKHLNNLIVIYKENILNRYNEIKNYLENELDVDSNISIMRKEKDFEINITSIYLYALQNFITIELNQ